VKKVFQVLAAVVLAASLVFTQFSPVLAQAKVFTLEELAKNDGIGGRPAYYAYQGVVYDVTDSPLWILGKHFSHFAGRDLSDAMTNAPHGEDIVKAMKVVGTMASPAIDGTPATAAAVVTAPQSTPQSLPTKTLGYEGRIRIFGLSILAWSGILLAVTFVINFATCFALPWSHIPLPWAGSKPGPDALDAVSTHKPWATIHKPFAWATVILGVIHGVLGCIFS